MLMLSKHRCRRQKWLFWNGGAKPHKLLQPLLAPFDNLDHFQILAKFTNANPLHPAMQMASSQYYGPFSS